MVAKRIARAEPESRASQRALRRQSIVEAASKLFAKIGYSSCEMERVADELKIAKGTLYLYFPGKRELFFACVDYGMKELQATVEAAANTASDPFARITRAIHAYLRYFAEHPEQVELLIQERAIFKDRSRPTYFEYRDAARVSWRKLYQSLIDSGRMRSDLKVESILDTMGNLVYGTMFTNHFLGRKQLPKDQIEALLDIIFHGLLSDRERRRLVTEAAAAN